MSGLSQIPRLIGYCRFQDMFPLLDCRKQQALPQNPQTLIVCLFPYYAGDFPDRNVARYACVNDYHRVVPKLLERLCAQLRAAFPGEEFAAFADDSPVREVAAAHCAGLGAIGRHGMLIHETYGSRVFIGEIATSLALRPIPQPQRQCRACNRCVRACPTGALQEGKPLNKELCRSFITQKKGNLSTWECGEIKAGGMVWGCDICSDVCPMNQNLPLTPIAGFLENIVPVITRQNLDACLADKPYNWRGKAVLMRNLAILEE